LSRCLSRVVGLLCLLGLTLSATEGRCQDAFRVLLVSGVDTSGAASRLRAELTGSGYVLDEAALESSGTESALALGQQHSARAVLRPAPSEVELWVLDDALSRVIYYERLKLLEGESVEALGLRASEVLRARLEPLRAARSAAPETESGDQAARTPESKSSRRVAGGPGVATRGSGRQAVGSSLWLHAGFGAAHSSGGVGVMPVAGLGAALELAPATLSFLAYPAFASREHAAKAGEVSIAVSVAALSGEVALLYEPLEVQVGAGLLGAMMELEGRSTSTEVAGRSERLFTWAPFGVGSVALPLGERVRLRHSLRFGAAPARLVVKAGDETLASWGHGLLWANLGLEVLSP
jgi:hypothetical protein